MVNAQSVIFGKKGNWVKIKGSPAETEEKDLLKRQLGDENKF